MIRKLSFDTIHIIAKFKTEVYNNYYYYMEHIHCTCSFISCTCVQTVCHLNLAIHVAISIRYCLLPIIPV